MCSAEKVSTTSSSDLQRAWAEGLASGPSQPFDVNETKRLAREQLYKLAVKHGHRDAADREAT
jgi:Arc/MetJ-type ribon-helix-helix transcriptional regulator